MPASTTDTITQGYGPIHKGRSTVRANLINHMAPSSHKNQPRPFTLRHHPSSPRIPQARLTSKSPIGPRTADLALHAFITVARARGGTLADVPVLLTSPAFRRRLLSQVSDPLVLGPYWAGYNALSDGERQQVISPLMNKLRAWLSRSAVRQMLGQAAPLLGIEDICLTRISTQGIRPNPSGLRMP